MRQLFTRLVELTRLILQFLLTRPLIWMANRLTASPNQEKVHTALTSLYQSILTEPGDKGPLLNFRPDEHPVIIFSDMHKGTRNGADDFASCENNFLAALEYYNNENFYFINLGDSEELWENILPAILKHNKNCFEAEKQFASRKAFLKIFGNHDLYWGIDPLAPSVLKNIYQTPLKAHTGAVLRVTLPEGVLDVFCTHGHQGDSQSDGNIFSKWFVSYIWGPLQSFLEINTNTPSCNNENKTLHNQYMYSWSAAQKNLLLITGHTHQPVFKSLTHLERLYLELEVAKEQNDTAAQEKIQAEIPRRRREYDHVNQSFRNMKPSYFNSGCCCFKDGNITGLEIAGGYIRLVKWSRVNGLPTRIVAEEVLLVELAKKIRG